MAKTPQDHQPKAAMKREPHDPTEKFVYESAAGAFELPYLENLTRGQAKKLQNLADGEDADDVLFRMLLTDEDYARLDDLPVWQYQDLQKKWGEESAVNLGE